MKKSRAIALVISGAWLAGCDSDSGWDTSQTYTNNTWHPSWGYYHAPYRGWYPQPYNHHDPARGFFHGGKFTPAPHQSDVTASRPSAPRSSFRFNTSTSRGGFSRSSGSHPSIGA